MPPKKKTPVKANTKKPVAKRKPAARPRAPAKKQPAAAAAPATKSNTEGQSVNQVFHFDLGQARRAQIRRPRAAGTPVKHVQGPINQHHFYSSFMPTQNPWAAHAIPNANPLVAPVLANPGTNPWNPRIMHTPQRRANHRPGPAEATAADDETTGSEIGYELGSTLGDNDLFATPLKLRPNQTPNPKGKQK